MPRVRWRSLGMGARSRPPVTARLRTLADELARQALQERLELRRALARGVGEPLGEQLAARRDDATRDLVALGRDRHRAVLAGEQAVLAQLVDDLGDPVLLDVLRRGQLPRASGAVLVDAHERPCRAGADLRARALGDARVEADALLARRALRQRALDLGQRVGGLGLRQGVLEALAGGRRGAQRAVLQPPAEHEAR